ncbi:MAG: LytTR family DNA-binding domain-containing protein [Lachnospiraceae bacterium]|nr:LytTR family DNA-binding domain-containing protein [Lachnospiraceae bacterium]
MTVYRGETEYFISPKKILFFETDAEGVCAHTRDEVYLVRHKLYELEELLPGFFVRVSKSTILNLNEIYSVEKTISTSSVVQFQNTYKQVYVSRHYLKALRDRLEEKRIRG